MAVRTAGMIWIVLGCLIALNGLVMLVLLFSFPGSSGGHQEWVGRAVFQLVFQVLIGALILYAGVQSLRGAARDTLGNGLGSILVSLHGFVVAVWAASGGVLFTAGVYCPVGAMLLAAGVLALVGASDYKRWRKAQKAQVNREAADRKAR